MQRYLPFVLLVAGMILVGCQDSSPQKTQDKPEKVKVAAEKKHAHDKYWCDEHGIPEEECLMCLKSEAELRKAKDWCEHDYAKSQCFKCNPALKEHFAAKYRAKYPGKEPPKPTEN